MQCGGTETWACLWPAQSPEEEPELLLDGGFLLLFSPSSLLVKSPRQLGQLSPPASPRALLFLLSLATPPPSALEGASSREGNRSESSLSNY